MQDGNVFNMFVRPQGYTKIEVFMNSNRLCTSQLYRHQLKPMADKKARNAFKNNDMPWKMYAPVSFN